ncbi:MAG: amino acid adenylation domain-containing protein [Eubacterium sp.]|nr:amino acid adenylation domain-containing protein [Eubacterium sp.]
MYNFTTIKEMFDISVKTYGDKMAHFWTNSEECESISYRELHDIALKFAAGLMEEGIAKDDKIMMQLQQTSMYAKGFWGVIYSGAVPMALPFSMADLAGRDVLDKQLNICSKMDSLYILIPRQYKNEYEEAVSGFKNVKLLVFEDIMEKGENAVTENVVYPEINSSDMCCILFSSGSTDYPKGVVLKQSTMVASILGALDIIDYTDEENSLSWLPMTHAFGFIGFHLIPICCGANQGIMVPGEFVKNPKKFLEKVSKYKISIFGAMNFAMKLLNASVTDDELKSLDLSNVKHLFLGAEPVNADIAEAFAKRFALAGLSENTLRPIYGLSESAFAIACAKSGEHFRADVLDINELANNKAKEGNKEDGVRYVSVGMPVTGLRFIVADENGNELPEGHIGELCYAGDCICDNYFFEENEESKRMVGEYLCSGDLGYYSRGEIIITGRKKDIIFVNGQNYYPLDIENRIARDMPDLKDKVIASQVYNYENVPKLILFIEYKGEVKNFVESCIKPLDKTIKNAQFLKFDEYLPIDAIPKTSSGKVKRMELAKNYINGDYDAVKDEIRKLSAVEVVEFEDDKSKEIQAVWNNILYGENKPVIGSFFEVGGDSIKLISLATELNDRYGITVSLKELVKVADVREFVELVKNKLDTEERIYNEKITVEPDREHRYEPFGLTEIQHSYLLGRNSSYDMGGISTHGYYEYAIDYDVKRLERALNKVIKNQDNLRLVMTEDRKQKILPEVPWYEIEVFDASSKSEEEIEKIRLEERERMSHAVFEPGKWPLFEMKCIKKDEKNSLLFFGIDLMIIDASSIQMLKDLLIYYYDHEDEEPKEMEFSFRDFMNGMEKIKKTQKYAADKKFWEKQLKSIPNAPALPTVKETDDIESSEFTRLKLEIDKEQTEVLKKIALENGISFSSVVCTAYAMALSMYSNQANCTLNVTIFNKYDFHPDVQRMMGDFTSTILLPFDFEKDVTLNRVFKDIQERVLTGLEHRYYTGVEVLRDLKKVKSSGNKAIMPIVFTSTLDKKNERDRDLGELLYAISQTSQVYLDCQAGEENGKLVVTWDYIGELFDETMMKNMFGRFEYNLMTMDKKEKVSDFCGLSPEDLSAWEEYNSTQKDFSYKDLYEMFAESAKRVPDNIAVEDESSTYTYAELLKASDGVAGYLAEQGIKAGDHVAVIAHRKKESIANILGVLKCGAAYVPVDPENPEKRQNKIIKDADCKCVLDGLKTSTREKEHVKLHPEMTAYIIYTSGSTGEPKGVVISHGAVCNTIKDINSRYEVTEDDRFIGMSSLCFDLSVYDVFGSLEAGACLVMVSEPKDIRSVAKTVLDKEVTVWNSVPAFVQMYMNELERSEKESENSVYEENLLRLFIMSGDWIPVTLPADIMHHLPGAQMISMGGATEASIWSIYYPIDEVKADWKSIPYGRPLANQKMYLLDQNGRYCPLGVPGEIFIGGKGVATEYFGREKLNETSFINHPKFGKIYRTGDYGRLVRDEDEVYMIFMGRKDSQIKLRGHRIELGEVEKALSGIKTIEDAVAYIKEVEGSKVLCAAVTGSIKDGMEALREKLMKDLPRYMIPSHIHVLGQMPLSSNGKVDRKALALLTPEEQKKKIAPRNPLEEKLHKIWQEVLGKEVGLDDNFYDFGGDSIKLFTVIERVESEVGTKIPKDLFFSFETIEEMEEIVKKQVG